MAKPQFMLSDDYAVLSTNNSQFYYGYEVTDENDEWCFTAKITVGEEKIEIKTPFSKLGARDQFDCAECLMVGIGWVITKYPLILQGVMQ